MVISNSAKEYIGISSQKENPKFDKQKITCKKPGATDGKSGEYNIGTVEICPHCGTWCNPEIERVPAE